MVHSHDYVNVWRMSRLRIHLTLGRKLLPLLHRTDVICMLTLKTATNIAAVINIYETHISRIQFLRSILHWKTVEEKLQITKDQCGHLLQVYKYIISRFSLKLSWNFFHETVRLKFLNKNIIFYHYVLYVKLCNLLYFFIRIQHVQNKMRKRKLLLFGYIMCMIKRITCTAEFVPKSCQRTKW